MHPKPALVGFFKNEGKGIVKLLMCAQPDELAFAQVDVGLESVLKLQPRLGVQPVAGHHQIVVIHVFGRRQHLGLKSQVNAQLARPFLQDNQQPHPPDPAKSVAGADRLGTFVDQRHIVPIGKMLADFGG